MVVTRPQFDIKGKFRSEVVRFGARTLGEELSKKGCSDNGTLCKRGEYETKATCCSVMRGTLYAHGAQTLCAPNLKPSFMFALGHSNALKQTNRIHNHWLIS